MASDFKMPSDAGLPLGGKRLVMSGSPKLGADLSTLPRAKPGAPMNVPFGLMTVNCSTQEWALVNEEKDASTTRALQCQIFRREGISGDDRPRGLTRLCECERMNS